MAMLKNDAKFVEESRNIFTGVSPTQEMASRSILEPHDDLVYGNVSSLAKTPSLVVAQ